MKVEKIALSRIADEFDDGQKAQKRIGLDQSKVDSIVQFLRDEGETLPVVLGRVENDSRDVLVMLDGNHRRAALAVLGCSEIDAIVYDGIPRADAKAMTVRLNVQHGDVLTNKEKNDAVEQALADADFDGWSNRAIARALGVGEKLVRTHRDPKKAKEEKDLYNAAAAAAKQAKAEGGTVEDIKVDTKPKDGETAGSAPSSGSSSDAAPPPPPPGITTELDKARSRIASLETELAAAKKEAAKVPKLEEDLKAANGKIAERDEMIEKLSKAVEEAADQRDLALGAGKK